MLIKIGDFYIERLSEYQKLFAIADERLDEIHQLRKLPRREEIMTNNEEAHEAEAKRYGQEVAEAKSKLNSRERDTDLKSVLEFLPESEDQFYAESKVPIDEQASRSVLWCFFHPRRVAQTINTYSLSFAAAAVVDMARKIQSIKDSGTSALRKSQSSHWLLRKRVAELEKALSQACCYVTFDEVTAVDEPELYRYLLEKTQ